MERRPYLIAAGSTATALLAGCLSEFQDDDSDDGNGDDASEGSSDDAGTTGPEAAVRAYLEAAVIEDRDAIAEATHSASFLDPEVHEEDDFEYRFDAESGAEIEGFDDLESFETEMLVEDGSVDDVLDLEGAAFVFDADELEAAIGDEEIALVRTEVAYRAASGPEADSDGDLESEATVWAVVTEDDEWQVFWAAPEDDAPEDPEEAFEEPIIDEDGDVVEEIDWDYDQDAGDGEFELDVEWAEVVLTDSPGLEADRVRIESTIEGGEFEFYGEEPNGWTDSWAYVPLNPEGDQIVVTAITDGEEEVVHREQFEP